MNIIEENIEKAPKNDNSKMLKTIILASIIVLFLIAVGLFAALQGVKKNTLVVTVNGKQNEKVKEMLIMQDNGMILVPIRGIASYLGYDSYNGDYTNKSEDSSKCWAQTTGSKDEIVSFALNSKRISKITNDQKQGTVYSYCEIDKEVEAKNGELYTTTDGIEKAFNVKFVYDQENKKIKISTMPYLVSSWDNALKDLGYSQSSKNFNDQKAILKNMLIVKKEKDTNGTKYGVINTAKKGESILEAKYTNISYIPETSDFLVEDDKKMGIISSTGDTKIRLDYDKIEILDSGSNLYVVKKNNKYGVVDSNGNFVISLDYDDIGVDISKFTKNDVKNKYLLAENLIPLKKGELWGFADKNGKIVTDFQFNSLGYTASSNKDIENLLVIENYEVVVACKDKKYILVNSLGELLWKGALFEDVYMTVSSAGKKYVLVKNGKEYDAEEQLDRIGAKVNSKATNETTNNSTTNTTNTTQNPNAGNQTTVNSNATVNQTQLLPNVTPSTVTNQ